MPVAAKQVKVTDSEGLIDTENLTMVIGEPFAFDMNPKSGKWVVGDTIKVIIKTKHSCVSKAIQCAKIESG